MSAEKYRRLTYLAAGAIVGFLTGAIIAVNFVIAAGVDRGDEASIPEVFAENLLVGVGTVFVLAAGPIVGVIVARRIRRTADLP